MSKKKEEIEKKSKSEEVLTLQELLSGSGLRLNKFIGILISGGLQQDYEKEVARLKEGKEAKPFITLSKFKKLQEKYETRVV